MRWIRAASVLGGPNDPRAEWGVSKLALIERVDAGNRDALLEEHDPAAMTVREPRQAVRDFAGGTRGSPAIDEPYDVLQRAIENHL